MKKRKSGSLTWNYNDESRLTTMKNNMIFTLDKGTVGVYGMGTCYRLTARKKGETKGGFIQCYWTSPDGGYGGHLKGFGNKLWTLDEILKSAEEELKLNFYI